jgi:hypothetical protein
MLSPCLSRYEPFDWRAFARSHVCAIQAYGESIDEPMWRQVNVKAKGSPTLGSWCS